MNSDFSILSKLSLLLTQLVNPQKSACKLLRTLRLCNICSIIQTFYGQNNSQKSSSIFFLKLLHVLHNIRYRNSRIYYCHHTSPNVFLASTECSKNGKKSFNKIAGYQETRTRIWWIFIVLRLSERAQNDLYNPEFIRLMIRGYKGHSELVPIVAERWKSIKYES